MSIAVISKLASRANYVNGFDSVRCVINNFKTKFLCENKRGFLWFNNNKHYYQTTTTGSPSTTTIGVVAVGNICTHQMVSCVRYSHSSSSSSPVRVRFAPSPTGELHVGGLRTALYNYLFARQNNGVFVLRCEDTDQTRLVPGAMERLIELLTWMGIRPDEGPFIGGEYGPYVQSERLDLYRKWVEQLIDNGYAYRCFCTSQRLDLLRREQVMRRETFQGYDNACRRLTDDKITEKLSSKIPFVIRFKLNNEPQSWTDLVHGDSHADLTNAEGDPIILKSDGYPTYHLANVIDDHYMNITHVLRGAEWLSSTAKHLQLFSSFGWTPPVYAHLPLLLNEDLTKLSKRQESLQLQHLKNQGYEPESIISLLSMNGGGIVLPHESIYTEGVSLAKALEHFNLGCTRTESTVLAINSLQALGQSYISRKYKQESKEAFCRWIEEAAAAKGLECPVLDKLYNNFPSNSERIPTINSLFEGDLKFIWRRPITDCSVFGQLKGVMAADCVTVLSLVKSALEADSYSDIVLDELMADIQAKTEVKKSDIYKILRVTLAGTEVGAPVALMFQLLDRREITARCHTALQQLSSTAQM